MPDHIDPEQEQGLVSRARDDPDALQALYRLYVRRIYGYVASRINNRQDAEDVVSEVFLRMVRTLDRFSNRHGYSFAAWIFTIARNAVSDYYRDRRKTEVSVSPDALPQPRADDPDAALSQQEAAAELRRRVRALPERQREVIVLRFFGGLCNGEIARVLEIDARTVASHLSRGLRTLRDAYTRVAEEEDENGQTEQQ